LYIKPCSMTIAARGRKRRSMKVPACVPETRKPRGRRFSSRHAAARCGMTAALKPADRSIFRVQTQHLESRILHYRLTAISKHTTHVDAVTFASSHTQPPLSQASWSHASPPNPVDTSHRDVLRRHFRCHRREKQGCISNTTLPPKGHGQHCGLQRNTSSRRIRVASVVSCTLDTTSFEPSATGGVEL